MTKDRKKIENSEKNRKIGKTEKSKKKRITVFLRNRALPRFIPHPVLAPRVGAQIYNLTPSPPSPN